MAANPLKETFEKSFEWNVSWFPRQGLLTKSFVLEAFDDTDVVCFASLGIVRALSNDYSSSAPSAQSFTFELRRFSQEASSSLECTHRVSITREHKPVWDEEKTYTLSSFKHGSNKSDLNMESGNIEINFHLKLIRNSHRHLAVSPSMSLAEFGTAWLNDKDMSDVVVVCGDKTFDCHKVILAGRSEVLKVMLNSQFKEAKENKIEIAGFEPEVAELLIKYIYTDDVSEDSISWELFEAAKMYEIARLQELCLKGLRKNISIQSCCRMLGTAMVHDLEDYFIFAMDFFKKNKEEVAKTDGWKQVLMNNALLGKIILYQM